MRLKGREDDIIWEIKERLTDYPLCLNHFIGTPPWAGYLSIGLVFRFTVPDFILSMITWFLDICHFLSLIEDYNFTFSLNITFSPKIVNLYISDVFLVYLVQNNEKYI